MSIEVSMRPDGTQRHKVRWKQYGASRAKSFEKERDAIRFDGEIKRRPPTRRAAPKRAQATT